MATSYSLTAEHSKALEQLEAAQDAGVSNWALESFMGRTLCALGRYKEALEHLQLAHRERKLRPDIVMWMRTTEHAQMHVIRANYYAVLYMLLLLIREPVYGAFHLLIYLLYLVAIGYRILCRRLFLILISLWPRMAKRLLPWLNPDMLEVDIAGQLAADGNFACAENVLRSGLRLVPDSVRLLNNLTLVIARQGRTDEALDVVEKAIILYPNNKMLLLNREAIKHRLSGRIFNIDARDLGNLER